ncbi:hypothetical protein niasHT_016841 [Heterodera trifolii]|uniref:Uncharacterized protein n=1 Tax=Heterodera trifolii TaxID=157864 RepID=A0ABD2KT97_9BILA
MGKLKEENDQKFEVQKATHRKTFENVTKNIEDEAEIGQMKRECSLFFQRFEECHRFTEEKIYELATKNGEIRQNLMQINVGGKALQTVGLQIRLTLFDGIERAMDGEKLVWGIEK